MVSTFHTLAYATGNGLKCLTDPAAKFYVPIILAHLGMSKEHLSHVLAIKASVSGFSAPFLGILCERVPGFAPSWQLGPNKSVYLLATLGTGISTVLMFVVFPLSGTSAIILWILFFSILNPIFRRATTISLKSLVPAITTCKHARMALFTSNSHAAATLQLAAGGVWWIAGITAGDNRTNVRHLVSAAAMLLTTGALLAILFLRFAPEPNTKGDGDGLANKLLALSPLDGDGDDNEDEAGGEEKDATVSAAAACMAPGDEGIQPQQHRRQQEPGALSPPPPLHKSPLAWLRMYETWLVMLTAPLNVAAKLFPIMLALAVHDTMKEEDETKHTLLVLIPIVIQLSALAFPVVFRCVMHHWMWIGGAFIIASGALVAACGFTSFSVLCTASLIGGAYVAAQVSSTALVSQLIGDYCGGGFMFGLYPCFSGILLGLTQTLALGAIGKATSREEYESMYRVVLGPLIIGIGIFGVIMMGIVKWTTGLGSVKEERGRRPAAAGPLPPRLRYRNRCELSLLEELDDWAYYRTSETRERSELSILDATLVEF